MREDLLDLLEKADLAVASCSGVIDDAKLKSLIEAVRAVRTRLAYPDDVLVVAFAGGTGSGKSSLFNAIAGEDLVDVGGVRPTTAHPAAAVPASVGPSLDGYLDRLGVDERHLHDDGRYCIIDLPDIDSVEVSHRLEVDALLPLVDLVVWVIDPEKYRDARLHDGYLKPMSDYSSQFLFVLNQIDRLDADQLETVRDDLEVALDEDWLEEPLVITMAAAPPSGPPVGLEDLIAFLEVKRATRETLYGKLLSDLAATTRDLESEVGSGLDFDSRAGEALTSAVALLVGGELDEASTHLTGFLDALAAETDGRTAVEIEGIAAGVPAHVRRIHDDLVGAMAPRPGRSWFHRRRDDVGTGGADRARARLAEAVVRPARVVVARRAMAVASVAELAVAVESLRSAPPR